MIEKPDEGAAPFTSLISRRPDAAARGELVWNEHGGVTTAAEQAARGVEGTVNALDPEPMPLSVIEEAPTEIIDATAGALASELARRRAEGLERLEAGLRTRRAELMQSMNLQHAEAERRIAEDERPEREAITRRPGEPAKMRSTAQPRRL